MESRNQTKTRNAIFISYRRDDARSASGRVWDWLRIGFGRERVFRDVASIGAGKWRLKIDQALASSVAVVAVIGRGWSDATNLPRLHNPNDVVRHELEAALMRGAREELTLIPLLVEDVQLSALGVDQLPESLQPLLVDWNVLTLTESGWDDDTRRLIEVIAESTGLLVNPELGDWMALMAGAQRGLSKATVAQSAGDLFVEKLNAPLESLLHRAAGAQPAERPALQAALAALAKGQTELAEDSFEEELAASQRRRKLAQELVVIERRRQADAARNVAILSMVRGELSKAVRYLQIALAADPEDLEAAFELGHAWIRRGDLAQAEAVFMTLSRKANQLGDRRQEARAHRGLGDVLMLRGDATAAASAYEEARAVTRNLCGMDPDHPLWQRDLAISHQKVGDGRITLGDASGAMAAYQASLAITERLASRESSNRLRQHDLSVSHDRVGEGWRALGNGSAALDSFQASLEIREALCEAEANNTPWQRDLSVSQEKVGDGLLARGDGSEALAAYQASLRIREELARRDPSNSQWQRDLSVSHDRIGNGWMAEGEAAAALASYRCSLSIREALSRQDPSHTQWQRDCFVSKIKIGDGLMALGDIDQALISYQNSLLIAIELSHRDSANLQALRDCYVSHLKIGDALMVQESFSKAFDAYRESLRIAENLVAQEPSRGEWQIDLLSSYARLGSVELALAPDTRRDYLCRGRDIVLEPTASDRIAGGQEWLDWFEQRLIDLDQGAAN